jgi:RHS repeat-associated protein
VGDALTMTRGGQRYFYHRDALGSTVALTDAACAVVERYLYDPYGRPTVTDAAGVPQATSAVGNPYLYTGQRYDAAAGQYDYRARTYDPAQGRFGSSDLIGYADSDNLYEYVHSRPTRLTDALGLACTGETCAALQWKPISLSTEGSIGPISWSASVEVEFSGEVCIRCCPEGTPRACTWVHDEKVTVTVTASASASASTYGGSVGPFSYWAGIKVSVSVEGTGTGTLKSDRCNNIDLCGTICVHAKGEIKVSGGAGVSVDTWFGTVELGADITGTGTVTVDKCLECCPACAWKPGELCLSASVDINVHAIIVSGTWNIWSGSKCWTI